MKSAVALNNLRDTKIYLTINLQSFYMTSMIYNFQLLMLRYTTSFLVNRYITLRNNKWMVYLCPVIGWEKLLVLREIRSYIVNYSLTQRKTRKRRSFCVLKPSFPLMKFPFHISIPYSIHYLSNYVSTLWKQALPVWFFPRCLQIQRNYCKFTFNRRHFHRLRLIDETRLTITKL